MRFPIGSIIRALAHNDVSSVSVTDDSLLSTLSNYKQGENHECKTIPIHNLIMILTAVIIGIALSVGMSIRAIGNYFLGESSFTANSHGALSVQLPAGREYVLFLFNTSDNWAETGIMLHKGDRIKLTMSGAYNSSLGHVIANADDNTPNDSRHILTHSTDNNRIKFRVESPSNLSNGCNSGEFVISKHRDMRKCFHTIKNAGTLQLAVADTIFNDENHLRSLFEKERFTYIPPYINAKVLLPDKIFANDTISEFGYVAKAPAGGYKKMYYYDNLGQILVCAEIKHPLRGSVLNPQLALRSVDSCIRSLYSELCSPLALLCSFLAFLGLIVWITFIIGVRFLVALLIAFLITYPIFWLLTIIKSKKESKPEKNKRQSKKNKRQPKKIKGKSIKAV